MRRQRLALGAVALVAVSTGVVVGARNGDRSDMKSDARAGPACPARIADDPRRLVGQMLVVRLEATATPELLRAARRGEIGGLIAFPPPGTPATQLREAIDRLQRAALAGDNPPLLVATDQEGGEVKRLPGPPDRSPAELTSAGAAATTAEGEATGRYLKKLGINVDLAPVFDLGPSESFVASRAFDADPDVVSEIGTSFAKGMDTAGVAATAKHFPGLGLATQNTDLAPSAVDATRTQLEPGLEPFRTAIAAGAPLVMIANAVYPAYEPEVPAVASGRVITRLLRGRLRFEGVVITDDLLAGALSAGGYDAGAAGVAAARAGADLLLYARAPAPGVPSVLIEALEDDRLDAARLRESCTRILALKARYAR